VYANDALQQSNTYDCGLYVCFHAFCYITDSYFFNTSSNGGRKWLFYNSKKYLELLDKKSAQDHTYFKENDTKPLNSDDITNITKLAKKQIENLFYTIQPLTIKLKSK